MRDERKGGDVTGRKKMIKEASFSTFLKGKNEAGKGEREIKRKQKNQ